MNKVIVALVALLALGTAQAQYQPTATPQPIQQAQSQQAAQPTVDTGYYINSSGQKVHRPEHTQGNAAPAGATAQCRDGTFSFSQHHRGTCSHHGGVAQWL